MAKNLMSVYGWPQGVSLEFLEKSSDPRVYLSDLISKFLSQISSETICQIAIM